MELSNSSFAIEPRLTADALPDAERLAAEAGWNQTAADWRIFQDFGSIYAIRDNSNRVVATAATLPYGGRFAWISMVLVAKEFQRRGFATRLLARCIDDLTSQQLVPVLDATPAGREVYRKLGFRDSWSFQRYAAGDGDVNVQRTATASIVIHAISEPVWPQLCAYDAEVFGADRSNILASLRARLPRAALYAQRDGKIVGLLLGREGRLATQLGPLVADGDDIAQALLAHALKTISGRIFADVLDSKEGLTSGLAARGFSAQRTLTRMLHKRNQGFDDGHRTFAVVGPEFG